MNSSLVWYAAYGSNLCSERFLCYIRGGMPPNSKRSYIGCDDKSLPRDTRSILIPHRLFFAGTAPGWGSMAMAFIRSANDGQSYGRKFLITYPQFDQLIQQEQGVRNLSATPICPPLSYIAANDFCFTNSANPTVPIDPKRRLRYAKILNLGAEGGYPIFDLHRCRPGRRNQDCRPEPRIPSNNHTRHPGDFS